MLDLLEGLKETLKLEHVPLSTAFSHLAEHILDTGHDYDQNTSF